MNMEDMGTMTILQKKKPTEFHSLSRGNDLRSEEYKIWVKF